MWINDKMEDVENAIDDEHWPRQLELKWLLRIDCVGSRRLTKLGIERTIDIVPLTGGGGGAGQGVWLLGQADELLGRVREWHGHKLGRPLLLPGALLGRAWSSGHQGELSWWGGGTSLGLGGEVLGHLHTQTKGFKIFLTQGSSSWSSSGVPQSHSTLSETNNI